MSLPNLFWLVLVAVIPHSAFGEELNRKSWVQLLFKCDAEKITDVSPEETNRGLKEKVFDRGDELTRILKLLVAVESFYQLEEDERVSIADPTMYLELSLSDGSRMLVAVHSGGAIIVEPGRKTIASFKKGRAVELLRLLGAKLPERRDQ